MLLCLSMQNIASFNDSSLLKIYGICFSIGLFTSLCSHNITNHYYVRSAEFSLPCSVKIIVRNLVSILFYHPTALLWTPLFECIIVQENVI